MVLGHSISMSFLQVDGCSTDPQVLGCHNDMERKQEEQSTRMKELQAHVERLQRENDQFRASIEKSHDLGKDVRDSDRAALPTAHNKWKDPTVPEEVDTPIDDELSSVNSPSLSLSSTKNAREGGYVAQEAFTSPCL